MTDVLQFLVAGLTTGSIYALVALGYHVIYAATKTINFAQGEQVVLGGLFAWGVLSLIPGVPLVVPIAGAVVSGLLVGAFFERLAFRPTYRGGELATILATIGAGIFFFHGGGVLFGRETKPFPVFSGEPNQVIDLLGVKILIQGLWILGLVLLTLLIFYLFFERTTMGHAIRAAAGNELGARLVGISPSRTRFYSVVIASGLAGLAGVMMAPITLAGGAIGTAIGIKGFAGAIVGGIDRPVGVVAGGLLVGIVEAFSAGLISSGLREPIAFSLLLLTLLLRPAGLLGTAELKRV